jgi:CubicO group peptidase (beta-lactamase class C family)
MKAIRIPNPVLAGILAIFLAASTPVGSDPATSSAAGQDSSQLVGVWGGRRDFGPEVDGTVSLSYEPSGWTAELAGYRLPVATDGEALTFDVPGDRGSFSGRFDAESAVLAGQWIQPGVIASYGQRFSSPVRLHRVAAATWRGVVTPLADRVHVFFVLDRGEDGKVHAFLRNPELNFGRFFDFTEVERRDAAVRLWGGRAGHPDAERQVFMEGGYREDPERLSLFIESLGGTYDLERIGEGSSSRFFPRSWQRQPYRYHPPVARDDGWRTGDLAGVGMAVEPIESLVTTIVSTPMDAIDAPAIDALLVARHGELVLEEYFHGWGPDQPHDTRSASKSLTSTMAGVAIRAGLVSLDTRLYDVMAHDAPASDLDPLARAISLRHLLTMSSGLACDDWDPDSPGGEDSMQGQDREPNWYRYVLALPMVHPPGEHAAYCSGGMNLVGGMIARAAGTPLTEYFDRYLAQPLEMGPYHTNLMPTGEAYAGGGLRITGRDFLKFGQLLLDDGIWNGHRLLDAGWSDEATTERNDLGGERLGAYGYGWWLIEYAAEGRRWRAVYAGGNGGNYIIVVPELDLTIAFLASNYNQAVMHQTKYEYVPTFILKSILDGERQRAARATNGSGRESDPGAPAASRTAQGSV